jgi:hypothetical protein
MATPSFVSALVAQLQLQNKIDLKLLKLKQKEVKLEMKEVYIPNDAVCAATDRLKRRNVVRSDFKNVA